MTGQTPSRPEPVDLDVHAVPQAPAHEAEHEQLARREHGERPARQQLEVPADDDAARSPAAGRPPGRSARRAASTGRSRGRRCRRRSRPSATIAKMSSAGQCRCPSPARERDDEEDRDQREARRSRSRSGSSTGCSGAPGERLGRRRPGAVEAGEPPERSSATAVSARARATGRVRHSSAAACAAPSSGSVRSSRPRRTCTSISPLASVRLPTVSRSGHAEQLGVGELLARARRRGRRRAPAGRSPAARRRAARRARAPRCRPCRGRRGGRPTARSPAATRCPARRRTARSAAAAMRAGPIP